MTGNRNIPFSFSNLDTAFGILKEHVFNNLNCHQVGTIENFDPLTQTASVTINTKRRLTIDPETWADYPLLLDCPVLILKGGSARITMPIQKGDECLIFFNDREFDNWFSNGGVQPFTEPRTHSLSDGIVLIGLSSLLNSIQNYNSDAIELNNSDTAKISIYSDHIDILAPINSINDIISGTISLQHHIHPTDTGVTGEPI